MDAVEPENEFSWRRLVRKGEMLSEAGSLLTSIREAKGGQEVIPAASKCITYCDNVDIVETRGLVADTNIVSVTHVASSIVVQGLLFRNEHLDDTRSLLHGSNCKMKSLFDAMDLKLFAIGTHLSWSLELCRFT